MSSSQKKINTRQAQWRLMTLWLFATAVPFTLMCFQTMMGRFDDRVQEAWGWLLPTIVPTIGVVVGTVVRSAHTPTRDSSVELRYLKTAQGVCIFYLALVTLVLIAAGFQATIAKTIDMMMQSNLFLGPVQGVVALVLGVFFVSNTAAHATADHDSQQGQPQRPVGAAAAAGSPGVISDAEISDGSRNSPVGSLSNDDSKRRKK